MTSETPDCLTNLNFLSTYSCVLKPFEANERGAETPELSNVRNLIEGEKWPWTDSNCRHTV